MRTIIIIILSLFTYFLQGQSLDDTIKIKEVIIKEHILFDKTNAGMHVTNIDSIVLMNKIDASLSTLLSENTPIYINSFAQGSMTTASFRGTASSHTQVQWNGMNINSPMLGMFDFSLIPVYLIDELKLYHGSASLSETGGGIGGAITIKNKANWDNKLNFQYGQGIGSFHTNHEYFKLEIGNKNFQVKTRVYKINSANDFSFINKSIGEIDPLSGEIIHPLDTNDNGAYYIKGILQEFYWQVNDKNIITLQYWGQDIDRNIPRISSYEGNEDSGINKQYEKSHKFITSWKVFYPRSKIEIKEGFEYMDMLYTLNNYVPGIGQIPTIYSESNYYKFTQFIKYLYEFDKSLIFNSDLRYSYQDVQTADSVSLQAYHVNRNEISLSNSVQKTFAKKLNINLLLRSEYKNDKLIPFIPFLGLDFKAFDSLNLIFKGNIARNYHFPSLNDLYWQPGGNSNLLEENGLSYEFSAAYFFAKKNFNCSSQITAYHSNINNWIIWLPSVRGYWEPMNIKRVQVKGLEFNLNSSFQSGNWKAKAILNYTLNKSINLGDSSDWGSNSYGQQLAFIPKHAGNILFNFSWKSVYFSYQHNALSERFTSSSNDIETRYRFYPYFMNNISLGKLTKWKNFSFSAELKIFNLFNETYHSLLIQPMPKRNYMLLLSLKYSKS